MAIFGKRASFLDNWERTSLFFKDKICSNKKLHFFGQKKSLGKVTEYQTKRLHIRLTFRMESDWWIKIYLIIQSFLFWVHKDMLAKEIPRLLMWNICEWEKYMLNIYIYMNVLKLRLTLQNAEPLFPFSVVCYPFFLLSVGLLLSSFQRLRGFWMKQPFSFIVLFILLLWDHVLSQKTSDLRKHTVLLQHVHFFRHTPSPEKLSPFLFFSPLSREGGREVTWGFIDS